MNPILLWFKGIQTYITIGLGVLLLLTSGALYVEGLRLDSCKAGRLADRESYKRAQAEATAIAVALKAEEERKNELKRQKADSDYAALSAQYRDALGLYKAAQRKARNPDLPREAPAPEGTNGPGESAVVLVSDLETCADNTARLEAARTWALSLLN
jgi:post-segregation antitoxin (ccd killing protein)